MRFAHCMLAVAVAGAVSGCGSYYSRTYEISPSYAYAPAPVYYETRSYDPYVYESKWDYYRNYNGSLHPGPEHYP